MNDYGNVLSHLKTLSPSQLLVSGPQRSGTTIAAKCLAHDLGLPFHPEEDFGTHNFLRFIDLIRSDNRFVLQCPTMAAYVHLFSLPVVFMRRPLDAILRSQERVGWTEHEPMERVRYFDGGDEPIAAVKYRAWDGFQRAALGEWAFDLEYESLIEHPLWVNAEQRLEFNARQTEIIP